MVIIVAACAVFLWVQYGPRDYSDDQHRTIDGITVVGDDLTRDDVTAIRRAVANAGIPFNKRIRTIFQKGRRTVRVNAGVVRGPKDGRGVSVRLKKIGGKWQVIKDSVVHWVS